MARPDLRALHLIAPAVRSRTASFVGAAVLHVLSAVAVSPALITQQLIDRGLAEGDAPLVAALACALVAAVDHEGIFDGVADRVINRGIVTMCGSYMACPAAAPPARSI